MVYNIAGWIDVSDVSNRNFGCQSRTVFFANGWVVNKLQVTRCKLQVAGFPPEAGPTSAGKIETCSL